MASEEQGLRIRLSTGGVLLLSHWAGEHTSSERRPGNRSDTEQLEERYGINTKFRDMVRNEDAYLQSREHLAFLFTVEQVVVVLHRDERRELVVDCVV